jgi:hypothetical protein
LACADFARGPVEKVTPRVISRGPTTTEELVQCAYFQMLRHAGIGPVNLAADARCHILIVLDGRIRIGTDDCAAGQTRLLPAASLPQVVTPQGPAVFLEVVWD